MTGEQAKTRVHVADTATEWNDALAFSQAVRVGDQLWIAGQVAVDANGTPVGVGDAYAQADRVWRNMAQVLAKAGGSLDDLVSTTTYIVDRAHREAATEARRRHLTPDNWPTNTLVIIDGLGRPEFLIEVSGVAVLGAG